jgi:hypothetical protein
VVEVRAGRKVLFHDKFSIRAPGSANQRHAKRAVDR